MRDIVINKKVMCRLLCTFFRMAEDSQSGTNERILCVSVQFLDVCSMRNILILTGIMITFLRRSLQFCT